MGVYGVLLAFAVGHTAAASVYFVAGRLSKFLIKRVEKRVWKQLLIFSVPLIPNRASWWINSSLDLFFRIISGPRPQGFMEPFVESRLSSILLTEYSFRHGNLQLMTRMTLQTREKYTRECIISIIPEYSHLEVSNSWSSGNHVDYPRRGVRSILAHCSIPNPRCRLREHDWVSQLYITRSQTHEKNIHPRPCRRSFWRLAQRSVHPLSWLDSRRSIHDLILLFDLVATI